MNHQSKYLIIAAFIFFCLQSCKENNDNPISQSTPDYDWEGEIGKFNEPYRDSILFNSDRYLGTSYAPSVHMMFKDGSGMRAKTNQWYTFGACWSPRKWKIFYMADTSSGKSARGVFVMNADGSDVNRITPLDEDVIGLACSPDGKKIAYVAKDSSNRAKIRITTPEGENTYDVSGNIDVSSFISITWSPDSKRIAFDFVATQISVLDIEEKKITTLFNFASSCWHPSWSPDGKRITFVALDQNTIELYVYNMTTSIVTKLTNKIGFVQRPSWSRDGNKIIFSSRKENMPDHIYIINADGSNLQQITNGDGSDWGPAW